MTSKPDFAPAELPFAARSRTTIPETLPATPDLSGLGTGAGALNVARRRSSTLTEAELRLMEVLWEKGEATVAEVTAALPPPPLAYNSVLTTLRILERKGYVAHDEAGRAFVYRTLVEREEAAGHAVGHLLSRFFDNSSSSLALRLIENERPSNDELLRLKALIEEYEERND